jgi:hypothetical protein
MNLSERLDKALTKRDLNPRQPRQLGSTPQPELILQLEPPHPEPPAKEAAIYQTVQEGLRNLHQHDTDEDGIRSFTVKNLGIDKIQLPMVVGEHVIEDIQHTKTGWLVSTSSHLSIDRKSK